MLWDKPGDCMIPPGAWVTRGLGEKDWEEPMESILCWAGVKGTPWRVGG